MAFYKTGELKERLASKNENATEKQNKVEFKQEVSGVIEKRVDYIHVDVATTQETDCRGRT